MAPLLAPIVGDDARVLILGNMPSAMSLAAQRYYGNPRNAFCRITGEILGFDADAPYDARVTALCAGGIAVWDVLRSCRREGSLDSAVERDSMVPNDFSCLFKQYPTISQVVFNGAAPIDQSRTDHAVRRQAGRLARRTEPASLSTR